MAGIEYKQREIVLVPFPYSDLSSSKRRPALIISNDEYNRNFNDVIVCVITSNLFKDEYSINLNSANLEYGILPEESVVKVHKLFTIDKSKIIKKFSIVNETYYDRIIPLVNKIIKRN
ncbi:MAG TPA: type II toxin-antitoxin system PemK/MazF family toxin [Ignavibacteria bacterium]|nr:type II toxin-antitoxin system PemK/MazF family toxin [Ignavibacteria bacterium]